MSQHIDRLVGLAGQRVEFVARLRGHQVAAIQRLTPLMALGNLIALTACFLAAWDSVSHGVLLALGALALAGLALAMRSWWRARKSARKRRGHEGLVARAVLNALLMGSLWGTVALTTYPMTGGDQRAVISTTLAGIISAGGFALAPLPQAMFAFLAPVVAGCIVSLALVSTLPDQILCVMLMIFSVVVTVSSVSHARVFIANLLAEYEAHEQKTVVGMLLKNFEESASDWLWQIDARGRFSHVSARCAQVTGLAPERLEGCSALGLMRMIAGQSTAFLEVYFSFRGKTPFRDIEIRQDHDGESQWWKITGQPIYDEFGDFAGFHGVCSDITESKLVASRVAYLAHHDSLTGALNRAKFNEELTEAVIGYEFADAPFALLYLDLDHFKAVNDTMGHQAGDALLIECVRRMEALLPTGCLLARLGGDEFAVLVEGDCAPEKLEVIARDIIDALTSPFKLEGKIAKVGTSIGIALVSDGAGTTEMLHHQADLALYASKQAGRGTWRFYAPEMDEQARETRALENDLAHAIARNQLELHFQPIIEAADEAISGFEALVRWNHPDFGLIPPLRFIPLAEKSGRIIEIGQWVLNEACRVAADWPRSMTVSVNLSSRQFNAPTLVDDVREAVARHGLNPAQLEIEITESILIERPETVIETLAALKTLGVCITMDDFGTGYSSLSYLWRFPFDKIKIDGSFVSAIESDKTARDIINTIGSLARNMGLKLTAEKVERESEIAFLKQVSCDYFQGYFYSKPLNAQDLAVYLLKRLTPEADAPAQARRRA